MSFVVCTSFSPSGVFTMYGFLSNGFTVRFRTSIPFNKSFARLSALFGYNHAPQPSNFLSADGRVVATGLFRCSTEFTDCVLNSVLSFFRASFDTI